MKKLYTKALIAVTAISAILYSCGKDDAEEYIPLPESPVVLDPEAEPHPKLSDYHFFEGELKNLEPAYGVLPYDLNSSLFTDYALKKRFIWMPAGQTAHYTTDGQVPDFPVGTVLIKNFYYENTLPNNTTIIIETRLLIKKAAGWHMANYVWNDAQTEAELNTTGGTKEITWMHNGVEDSVDYKIPTHNQCMQCHAQNDIEMPIGPKPQNINKMYAYADGSMNQLARWKQFGYLDTYPQQILSTVNWEDTAQPLELRVRSYLDVNCAHCHTQGADCGYTPMDLAFANSITPENLGICREPVDFVSGREEYIVSGQETANSLMYWRMNNTIQAEMMPPLGRVTIHTEGVQLIEEWINAMESPCP
ncbi:hypothetical protein AM493_08695 [Flavobacterium akiainvivens]|uniref:Uncharacterized protein n=1 Tax=Flavobacterium akiainvivens TaxID=1202724 RepID=A0A0N0RQQ7_9FLAO|nr:SO2930 family diheme c-type cytochrome [Flavobacterium akiainvivens]KOS06106.1 hypothetical protein AM493_08695 [Flavobacterium akiainvivens]SFQ54978.1 conserved hypothetical protein, HNE_0200 family [Flavobacterium akiainvivens]